MGTILEHIPKSLTLREGLRLLREIWGMSCKSVWASSVEKIGGGAMVGFANKCKRKGLLTVALTAKAGIKVRWSFSCDSYWEADISADISADIYTRSESEGTVTEWQQGRCGHGLWNKLASSVDAIAISEIWNYDPLTDWLTHWLTRVGAIAFTKTIAKIVHFGHNNLHFLAIYTPFR